jgi:hypothetical protein
MTRCRAATVKATASDCCGAGQPSGEIPSRAIPTPGRYSPSPSAPWRKGSRDWACLRSEGCTPPVSARILTERSLPNAQLTVAIRALSSVQRGSARVRVNWRDLDTEEFGGV